jgi:Tfp pilus assembly protein FimT
MKLGGDAGFSVLELIVALGIAAGLLVVVAASLPRPAADAGADAAAIVAFVSEARSSAILSGTAAVLAIGSNSMTIGGKRIQWTDDLSVATSTKDPAAEYRLILYPDGSYSGATLYVRSPTATRAITGVYRSNPTDG